MTPRERAEATCREWMGGGIGFVDAYTAAITSAISDQTAALQAALEELTAARKAIAALTQERDELALTLEAPLQGVHPTIVLAAIQWWGIDKAGAVAEARIAAHDRNVAARVLNDVRRYVDDCSSDTISEIADAYERGEREVPA